ncbi:MAG: tRNA (adenosine(37)-N6)-threonylcarbamoyltransferase complex ATPase subunit type 1 TsaE [Candidatus Pacebacteria bacterium]|nr:tRNA (adenosine(37)-N6)-threonylcarbamoyltransferase complex ATPase subunit type 1 TsaE [Candidatus Paceibacterota bacterium]
MEEIITDDYSKTKELGFLTALKVLDEKDNEKAIVIVLNGELGAGKTTFLQGFANGLGIKRKIQSPTFIIMNHFKIKDSRFKDYYHFDCYRLGSEQDMDFLDFDNLINDPSNIICIEWGENIKGVLPERRIDITFKVIDDKQRKIIIK